MLSATSRDSSGVNSLGAPTNPYETDRLLNEYLLFHFGSAQEVLRFGFGPFDALDYPRRCALECSEGFAIEEGTRALDLGCAVGGSAFELARNGADVIGIDYSKRFVDAAEHIRRRGSLNYVRVDEGALTTPLVARLPEGVQPSKVCFEQGDAMDLRKDLGSFDLVLMANLIDRLSHPVRCLKQLAGVIKPGGRLVITSPYTWLSEYTACEEWLGGTRRDGEVLRTLQGLRGILEPDFILEKTRDLPFLIREHERKFQWSVAEASTWRRQAR